MNQSEDEFAAWARSEGWAVTKQGWPDFICRRGQDIMAVEVKYSDGLSAYQQQACLLLAAHGIPTYLWSPPGPLRPFEASGVSGVQFNDAATTLRLAAENDALRTELDRQRLRAAQREMELANRASEAHAALKQMRDDLGYLIRLAEWQKDRTVRLRAIFRRYPDELLGIRPGLRHKRPTVAPIVARADEAEPAA